MEKLIDTTLSHPYKKLPFKVNSGKGKQRHSPTLARER